MMVMMMIMMMMMLIGTVCAKHNSVYEISKGKNEVDVMDGRVCETISVCTQTCAGVQVVR